MTEIKKFLGFSIVLNEKASSEEQFVASKGNIVLTARSIPDLEFKIKSNAWVQAETLAFLGNGYSEELSKIKILKFNNKTGDFKYQVLDNTKFNDPLRYHVEIGQVEENDYFDKKHLFEHNSENEKIFNELKNFEKEILIIEDKQEDLFAKLTKGKVF